VPSTGQQEKVSHTEQLDLERRTQTVELWSEQRINFSKSSAWRSLERKERGSHKFLKKP